MSATQLTLLTSDSKSDQMFRAIRLTNRLVVAEIRLKRANLLSDRVVTEIKKIREDEYMLSDSLILGEDVLENLNEIEARVTQLEMTIDA